MDMLEAHNSEEFLVALRSTNETDRFAAAYHIRRLVSRAGRELSGEVFSRFEDELYNQLFALVHSSHIHEKLGGVLAIEALIGAPSAEPETRGIKFANVLSNALKQQCSVETRMGSGLPHGEASRTFVTKTAAALGRLAKRGPASSSDHVEFEVIRALEWLQHSGDNGTSRRLTACLVLRELAKHAPTLFYTKVRDFFDRIWPALVDARSPGIRDAAASALGAALEIISQRPTAQHAHYYCSIYSHAHAALAPYIAKQASNRSASEKTFADPPPLPQLHTEGGSVSCSSRYSRENLWGQPNSRECEPTCCGRVICGKGEQRSLSPQHPRPIEAAHRSGSVRSMSARHSGSDPLLKSSGLSGRAPFSGHTVRSRLGMASAAQEVPSCQDDTTQLPGPNKAQGDTSRRKPWLVSSTEEGYNQGQAQDFALSRQIPNDARKRIQFFRTPEAPPTSSATTDTTQAKLKLQDVTEATIQVTAVERTIPSAVSRFISVPATTEATAHGALLVVGALLNYAGQFMMPRFREACDAAIALREHRSHSIRKAATELLPRLAQYCPDAFSRSYLATTTQHLLKIARQRSSASELRDASYAAIGRLALAVRHHLITSLPDLVQVICEHGLNVNMAPPPALTSQPRSSHRHVDLDLASTPELRAFRQRGFGGIVATKHVQHLPHQKSFPLGPPGAEDQRSRAVVIDCVADVVEALRDDLGPHYIDAFLDALFAGGLSEPLIRALNVVSKSLPSRRPLVRARLLDELTSILIMARSSPYSPPGWSRPVPYKRLAEITTQKQRRQQLGGYSMGTPLSRVAHRRLGMISGFQNYGTLDAAPAGLHPRSDRNRGLLLSSVEDSSVLHVPPEREGYILLALQALGEFSMEGVCLLPLVRDCVSRYLDCATSSHIRAAAVVSCARLLLPPRNIELDSASSSEILTTSRMDAAAVVAKLQSSVGPQKKGSAVAAARDERHRMRKQTASIHAAMPRRLAFVEESAHDEYDESSEDDEDENFGDDEDGDGDEDTADSDSASVATSSDSAHIIRRPHQDDIDGYQHGEHTINGISSSARSQRSDDSTVIPHASRTRTTTRRRASKRKAATTDASSTRTDDSNDSILLFSRRRSTSRQLADDVSIRGDGLGSAASIADRRMRRPCPSLLGLMDSSLSSRVDDTLPPWYYVGPSAVVVEDVLRKLLRVALADVETKPRAAVLKALRADDRFDKHLCRAPHIEAISLLLHDEDAELQLAALALLGRLAAHNPAVALSHIRDALSRALAALRCDASDAPVGSQSEGLRQHQRSQAKERAARLAATALRAESPKARRCVWPLAAAVVASLPLGFRELGAKSGTITPSLGVAGCVSLPLLSQHAFAQSSMSRASNHQVRHGYRVGASANDASHTTMHGYSYSGRRMAHRSLGEDDGFSATGVAGLSPSLMPKPINAVPNRLACASLDALAECVLVLGPRARTVVYTPRVLSPLFDALLDRSSSRKRELALKVLGRLASSAGCAVAPYLEHPPLLPRMLAVLRENYGGPSSIGSTSRGGMPWSLCREALRALGLVGALDPYKFELVQRGAQDCRKHAARLAYSAQESLLARQNVEREVGVMPVPVRSANRSGQSQPINIKRDQLFAANVSAGRNATLGSRIPGIMTSQKSTNPNESPLLAPHVAALLEDDEDEPAHAAMYAQSCAVALPVVRDDPPPFRKLSKRDTAGLLEATGMNAGELAIDGAMRGDDVDAYYFLAHIVVDEDMSRDVTAERDEDFMADRAAYSRRRVVRTSTSRAVTPGAGEEFYARVAIDALVRVLRDASLAAHHAAVTQALTFIFQSLGVRCVPFLGDIVPHLLDVARSCEPGLRESILLQLAALASIVRQHLREWLPRIFDLIVDYWQEHLEQVVPLLEEIATSVSEHLALLVPRILPLLLTSLGAPFAERPTTKQAATTSIGPQVPKRIKHGRSGEDVPRTSLLERAYNDAPMFDDEPLLHTSMAAAAPAAVSQTRLALVLRATMLLREALLGHLFLVVPALLRLADALGDTSLSSGDASSEHSLRYQRALEDGDAQRAARIFERTNFPPLNSQTGTAQHSGISGGDNRHVASSRYESGGKTAMTTMGHYTATLYSQAKENHFPSSSYAGDMVGSSSVDEVDVSSPATKIQRDFTAPAFGPMWQARIVRCVRVVCGRGALMRRKDLGARIARALCRLLERSGLDTASGEPRPSLEVLREACADAFLSVACQLGTELYAPFERTTLKALALGPRGAQSKAATRWAAFAYERGGARNGGSGILRMNIARVNSDEGLSESTVTGSQNDEESSEIGDDSAIGSYISHRLHRSSSVDARFEDAAVDEISAVARRAGQRDAPATALRRHRATIARTREQNADSSHARLPAGGSRADADSTLHSSDDVRRGDRAGTGEKSRAASRDEASARQRLHVNQPNLQKAWDVSQRLTADDWNDWLRRLSLELLRESPSAALRSCATVAHAYPRLARQLFQPAFVSCWLELDDGYRDSLVRTLEAAFRSNELHAVAPDALQLLLDLAEFMERDVDALPIDIRVLADLATKCRAYAKALHYKELEYRTPELARDRHAAAEALIAINRKLAQPEAALGVLHATRRHCIAGGRRVTRHRSIVAEHVVSYHDGASVAASETGVSVAPPSVTPRTMPMDDVHEADVLPSSSLALSAISPSEDDNRESRTTSEAHTDENQRTQAYAKWGVSESWLGKLGSHEEALWLYQRRLENDPCDVEAILGAVKSLDALGDWQGACSLLVSAWPKLQSPQQHRVQRHKKQQKHAQAGKAGVWCPSTTSFMPSGLHRSGPFDSSNEFVAAKGAFGRLIRFPAVGQKAQSDRPELGDARRVPKLPDISLDESSGPAMKNSSSRETRLLMKAANVGARAAWALGRWDEMETFVSSMEDDDGSKPFYRAILALKPCAASNGANLNLVADLIDDARRSLHSTFAALVAESYKRAYQTMVMVQQLSELEEIVDLRKAERDARIESVSTPQNTTNTRSTIVEQRKQLVARWRRRLAGCSHDVSTWQRILNVRSLVLTFSDDPETWLQYASLCRHSGQSSLSEAVLTQQLGFDPNSKVAPASAWTLGEHRLRYAYAKHAWAAGKQEDALSRVKELANALGDLQFDVEVKRRLSLDEELELRAGVAKLRARCLLRLGDWQLAKRSDDENKHRGPGVAGFAWPLSSASTAMLSQNHTETRVRTSGCVLKDEFSLTAQYYEQATQLDPTSYKAWHAWALVNYRAVQRSWAARYSSTTRDASHIRQHHSTHEDSLTHAGSRDERRLRHVRLVAAASAFVRAISLGRRRWAASVQQDLLNLLNLWFRFGRQPDVEALLLTGCDQDEIIPYSFENDDDNAAFLAAAAAACSSQLQQAPGVETTEGRAQCAIASTNLSPAGDYGFTEVVKGMTSLQTTSLPGAPPFPTTQRPCSPSCGSVAGRRVGPRGAPLDAWLGVLPQLIARIGSADSSPKSALHRLLARLGARHPQALVYPLALQLKSPREERRTAAAAILLAPRRVAPQLVEQALLVSEELIRVAILWQEKWYEGLEEASRLYFGDGDVDAMLATLRPLHAELEAGPRTLRENAFHQAFGRDLAEAKRCLDDYKRASEALKKLPPISMHQSVGMRRTRRRRNRGRFGAAWDDEALSSHRLRGNDIDGNASGAALQRDGKGAEKREKKRKRLKMQMDTSLNQAWDLYYTVYRRVNKQLPQLTTLELKYVSPALVSARNLQLAVPGTYRVDGTAARILRFGSSVQVITSKQRPRKLSMRGSDGREYEFLLKGHEDLRQDERAMQLFGLANALLAKDRRTCEHGHLLIQRYAVTPLSHNCGVVGWVPACDTLHALIRDFREARKIVLNGEHRVMMQLAPDYDQLTLAQKVEVFQAALADVAGQDLSKVLWLKSAHSEQWLERRTHYTRSLATMSMVGHILGLGDRHPSNLMLDRRTGKVLHIDFGDCFTEEHQLLTNIGFMSLEEVLAFSGEKILFASYDSRKKKIVYEEALTLIVNPEKDQHVVELTHELEAERWENGEKTGYTDALPSETFHSSSQDPVIEAVTEMVKKNTGEAELLCSGLSLITTPKHYVYIEKPTSRNGVGRGDPNHVNHNIASPGFKKVAAGELVGGNEDIRLLASASGGLYIPSNSDDAARVFSLFDKLKLATIGACEAFCEIYGIWLTCGCLVLEQSQPREIGFSFDEIADVESTQSCCRRAGVESIRSPHDANCRWELVIRERAWVDYFFSEYGKNNHGTYRRSAPMSRRSPNCSEISTVSGKSAVKCARTTESSPGSFRSRSLACGFEVIKPAQRLCRWVFQLEKRLVRAVLKGLHKANGNVIGDSNIIFSSSSPFRDEIVHLCLHAGYKVCFDECAAKEFDTLNVDLDTTRSDAINNFCWQIAYSEATCSTQPMLNTSRDIKLTKYRGRTWCVRLPHGFVIVRRARKHKGVVTTASMPTIQSNCFEVAMHRDKFPERVPFRLTRMLVNAMEVSGVEGTFRSTCERVMHVLRHNRDSLLSMLEAFIHDPLISWRLLGATVDPELAQTSPKRSDTDAQHVDVGMEPKLREGGPSSLADDGSRIEARDRVQSDEEEEEEDDDEYEEDDDREERRLELKDNIREDESVENSDDDDDDDEDDGRSDDGPSDEDDERSDDEEYPSYASEDTTLRESGASCHTSMPVTTSHPRIIERNENHAQSTTLNVGSTRATSVPRSSRDRVPMPVSRRCGRITLGAKSQVSQQHRNSMHLRMTLMAASQSLNSTRYSAHSVHDLQRSRARNSVIGSIANSRLDHRSARERELMQTFGEEGSEAPIEALNEKAVAVMARVEDKLTGCDFDDAGALSVVEQVDCLIQQATDVQNLCQAFVGWCPFW